MTDFDYKTTCPWCGRVNDMAGNIENDCRPKDGDVVMCIDCGQWAVFERKAKGRCRKPTKAEGYELAENPDVQGLKRAWARLQALEAMERGAAPKYQ